MANAALAYHEPDIVTILIQSSFLLMLNVVGFIVDHVIYCGLVGQILIGMAWGTPGAAILSRSFEETTTQLGYLGLIMIVFEGGLVTSAKSVSNSLVLSVCVALTGIGVPMALSFALTGISHATKLQAFAAGASLCSTSLGTTFSILKSTGLATSWLGTILTTAAVLDDVVGLVLVQVISNLGPEAGSISSTTVLRPVLVSLAFATVLPLGCKFLLKPVIPRCSQVLRNAKTKFPPSFLGFTLPFPFLLCTTMFVGLVTSATYAGTSNLLAAYLAGVTISWIDEVSSLQNIGDSKQHARTPRSDKEPATGIDSAVTKGDEALDPGSIHESAGVNLATLQQPSSASRSTTPPPSDRLGPDGGGPDQPATETLEPAGKETRAMKMYNCYYAPSVDSILKPLFFASIGFSIPISRMFRGRVIWKGVVYAVLMAIGKLCCGLWLVRFTASSRSPDTTQSKPRSSTSGNLGSKQKDDTRRPARPKSLYPAAILGCAMVARGEIGFLISALAATNQIFSSPNPSDSDSPANLLTSDIYLVVTWAILLCTIVGPLALGFLAKRVRKLQNGTMRDGEHRIQENPLGVWGVK